MNARTLEDLLVADLALRDRLLDVKQVAEALRCFWNRREDRNAALRSELASLLGDEDLRRLRDEVRAIVGEGDPKHALARVGGLDRAIHVELDRIAPAVVGWLTQMGGGPRAKLRKIPRDRYLDFMPIGEGGMGAVYRALDTELNRYVALKIVRREGSSSGDGVTPSAPMEQRPHSTTDADPTATRDREVRFLQEAWITGSMEHPGIVPVHELGKTEAGTPCYTMRLVRGNRTLADAIRDAMDPDARTRLLEAFIKICDTISYAHSKGVIHRDLKSANIAIGEFGEVFVLDWGLAKARGLPDVAAERWRERIRDFRDATDLHTVAEAIGTPGHMAPEAARTGAVEVDERSDIYSLGVVLFEVLTGRLPFEFQTFPEYVEKVTRDDAPSPRSLDPSVPSALSELCVRALSRSPEKRPASAGELADGVRTWQTEAAIDREVEDLLREARGALGTADGLSGEKLLWELDRATTACRRIRSMRPDNREAAACLEQAGELRERGIQERERSVRRRALWRAGVAALAVVAVAAFVIAGVLREQAREAQDARAQAVDERESAEKVLSYLLYDLRENLEPTGRLDLLAQVAHKSQEYYESLPAEGISADTRDRRAVALVNLGNVFRAQGDLPQARTSYEKALEIANGLVRERPDDSARRFRKAFCESKIGEVLHAQGDRAGALTTLLEQAKIMGDLEGRDPARKETASAMISTHNTIGEILRTQGNWGQALSRFHTALRLAEDLATEHSSEVRWQREAVSIRLSISRVQQLENRMSEARATAIHALDQATRLAERHPEDLRCLEVLARSYARVGDIARAGLWFETVPGHALGDFEAALEIWKRLSAREPSNQHWTERGVRLELAIGDILRRRGETPAAWTRYRSAFDTIERLAQRDPTNAEWQHLIVTLSDRLAVTFPEEGDHSHILGCRRRAAEAADGLLDRDPDNHTWRHLVAYARSRLGIDVYRAGDQRAAIENFRLSLEVCRPLAADLLEDPELQELLLITLRDAGTMYRDMSDIEAARGHFEEGLEWARKLRERSPDHVSWLFSIFEFSAAMARTMDPAADEERAAARRFYEEGLEALRRLESLGETDVARPERIRDIEQALRALDE